jgi:hypothetical protein
MKAQRLPREHFDKLSDKPIEIKPFDPESKRQSYQYLETLNEILPPFGASAELFGSVELEIAGKGEWEFCVTLDDEQWYPVLTMLINHFGGIFVLTDDFAVFNDDWEGTPIEVIPLRGEAAQRNKAIMEFWRNNPAALKEYEQGKYEHANSKREYRWWKQNLIADILESL